MSTLIAIVIVLTSLILKFVVTLLEGNKTGRPLSDQAPLEGDNENEDTELILTDMNGQQIILTKKATNGPKSPKSELKTEPNRHIEIRTDIRKERPKATHSTLTHHNADDKQSTSESKNAQNRADIDEITNNFDLRSAVIYSEIMSPKFKDND